MPKSMTTANMIRRIRIRFQKHDYELSSKWYFFQHSNDDINFGDRAMAPGYTGRDGS